MSEETGTAPADQVTSIETLVAEELRAQPGSADRVMNKLASNCIVLKVSVQGVMQECKIADAADVTVAGQTIDQETVARVTGLAMPKSVRTRIGRMADAIRQTPAAAGTRFPGGAHLIPLRAGDRRPAEAVLDRLRALRAEYTQTAVDCRADWEAHMAELRVKNPPVYTRVVRAVPDGAAFVAAHTVKTTVFPIGRSLPASFWGRARNFLAEHLDDRVLSQVVQQLRHLATAPDRSTDDRELAGWMQETREASDRLVRETLTAMIEEPVREFAASLAHIEEAISSDSRIQQSSVDRMREAWTKLTSFEFMLPGTMQAQLVEAGRRLNALTSREVNAATRDGAGGELAGFFRSVRENVTSVDSTGGMVSQAIRTLDLD